LDNFFQISSFFIPQNKIDALLPVFMENIPGAQFFLSFGSPGSKVAEHSHEEGDGFRFITSGSILFDGKELKGGDWMFIPQGKPYSFEVGPQGVGICYCYACCCA
jgi:quercetin dioxygenase-like cupin family protein